MLMFKHIIKLISILGISFFVSCGSSESTSTQSKNESLDIGAVLPNIKLESNKESNIDLAHLRGSIVLVDFWASWCAPCRKENKQLVKLEEKFRDAKFKNGKGFKIYSVSLDGSGDPTRKAHHKQLWNKAIKADHLIWPYHVSDLKGWTSPLIDDFKIDAIPASYLIDSKGNILAKDLSGHELEAFLMRLLDI